jgi:hypothetical protein
MPQGSTHSRSTLHSCHDAEYAKRNADSNDPLESTTRPNRLAVAVLGTVKSNSASYALDYERSFETHGRVAIADHGISLVPLGGPPTRFCPSASTSSPYVDPGAAFQR